MTTPNVSANALLNVNINTGLVVIIVVYYDYNNFIYTLSLLQAMTFACDIASLKCTVTKLKNKNVI